MNAEILTVKVQRKTLEATDIYSFELVDPEGRELPAFTAGSHIDVHPADGLVRQYSLCNNPAERHRYVIGVLRDPNSRGGSIAMHEAVNEGDLIQISQPRNLFALEAAATRSILFAGGIGVTPILCMAEELTNQGKDFEMHYFVRSRDRAAFVARMNASAFASRVSCHFDDAPETKADLAALLDSPAAGRHLYVCGPGGFMGAVLGTAEQKGWAAETLHREYFAAPAAAPAADDGAFEVKLARTGGSYTVPADKTVVQVLNDNGIFVPTSCEQGICGTCITRIVEGEPDHRDFVLTDEERAANREFVPCCSRAKSKVLVLDL